MKNSGSSDEEFPEAMVELLEVGYLQKEIHAEQSIHAAAGRKAMRHDLKVLDAMTERNDFWNADKSQLLPAANRKNARTVRRQRRVAPNRLQSFGRHQGTIRARVDSSANEKRSLRADKFDSDCPYPRNEARHSECGREAGREHRTRVVHIETLALVSFYGLKQIFFPRTMADQPSRFWLKYSLINSIKLNQQPLFLVALADFFDGLGLLHEN